MVRYEVCYKEGNQTKREEVNAKTFVDADMKFQKANPNVKVISVSKMQNQ